MGKRVQTCTPQLFEQATQSSKVAQVCAEIEDALEKCRRGEMSKEDFETFKREHKKLLPIVTPHAIFRDGVRKNENAIPNGLSMYDKDHIPDPRGYWEAKREELRAKNPSVLERILLVHVTPSLEGLRLVFRMPPGMNLPDAQLWMSKQLGDTEYDSCVKDLARPSFLVPADYILYQSVHLFDEDDDEVDDEVTDEKTDEESLMKTLKAKGETMDRGEQRAVEETLKANDCAASSAAKVLTPEPKPYPTEYLGIPYPRLIEQLVEQLGGAPEHGSRNTFIFTLVCNMRYVCDDAPVWITSLVPTFGEDRKKAAATIQSACNRKQSHVMPAVVRRAIMMARKQMAEEQQEKERAEKSKAEEEDGKDDAANQPPPMPRKLPRLIELLVSRTPTIYKPAVAHAVFPALGAHLWRTRFLYIDNVAHEATLCNVLMADTGAGKDCISQPINHIMADIRRRDEENLERERLWKEECNSKASNKDKRKRPEGLVIQEVDPDMTNPAFVMRTKEADEHFLYTKLNEIDQFDALKGSGGQQFRIMCLAFDPDNRYGQTRVGTMSVTEKVCIRFNWNASTTIQKGRRYFARVLTDGPISRINFCTIPPREIGAEMPVYGTYDSDFDEQLRPYIDNLCKAVGLIDCQQAFQLAKKLKNENAEFARVTQSRVYENLSFRANVIGYLKACVLYVANGMVWEKSIEEFIRWSVRYDLWCKMQFFGDAIEEAERTGERSNRRGPVNLLQMLPQDFSYDDAVRVRQADGKDEAGTKDMLDQWVHRKYIKRMTVNDSYRFHKLKYK